MRIRATYFAYSLHNDFMPIRHSEDGRFACPEMISTRMHFADPS